jgi:hypothetical protein
MAEPEDGAAGGEIVLDEGTCEPGGTLYGAVRGVAVAAGMQLVLARVERTPVATRAYPVAACTLDSDAGGRFSLDLPPDLPPSAQGRRCSLDWVLHLTGADEQTSLAQAPVELLAERRPRPTLIAP